MTTTNSVNLAATSGAPFSTYTEVANWTPVITGTTVAGVGTYTTQVGRYTIIGKMVFITCNIVWTAHTGTGNMTITGLPFAARTIAGNVTIFTPNIISVDVPALALGVIPQLLSGSSTITMLIMRDNNTNLNIAMDAAGTVQLSGWYLIT